MRPAGAVQPRSANVAGNPPSSCVHVQASTALFSPSYPNERHMIACIFRSSTLVVKPLCWAFGVAVEVLNCRPCASAHGAITRRGRADGCATRAMLPRCGNTGHDYGRNGASALGDTDLRSPRRRLRSSVHQGLLSRKPSLKYCSRRPLQVVGSGNVHDVVRRRGLADGIASPVMRHGCGGIERAKRSGAKEFGGRLRCGGDSLSHVA